jgi:hypothetical protein
MPLASYVLIIIGLVYLIKPSVSIKSTPRRISFPQKILSPKQYLFYKRITGIIAISLAILLATILRK